MIFYEVISQIDFEGSEIIGRTFKLENAKAIVNGYTAYSDCIVIKKITAIEENDLFEEEVIQKTY